MTYYVYLLHNIVNNKVYVGKTNDMSERWYNHCSLARSTNKKIKYFIHYAIAKYGLDSFTMSIIRKFDLESICLQAEKYWIEFYGSRNAKYGYNLTDGGEGISGWHHTPETLKKMSAAHTGKTRSASHRESIRLARLGQKRAESTVKKLSGANSAHAKLTQEIVDEIRKLYATDSYSHRDLAKIFDISNTQITNILNNRQWK